MTTRLIGNLPNYLTCERIWIVFAITQLL